MLFSFLYEYFHCKASQFHAVYMESQKLCSIILQPYFDILFL